jgi:toxin secretion/phage lysis holin
MSDKVFAYFRGVVSMGAGVLSYLYGSFDGLLTALCVAVVLDYVTGLIKAGVTHTLSSEIGFKGILKKVLIMLIVALAHVIDNCVGSGDTWRNIAIVFYICNEGISILENAVACGLPVPDKLKEILQNMEHGNSNKIDDIKLIEESEE